jgi:hypothetical protein
VASILRRGAGIVTRAIENAAGNFARVRGADLLRGTTPSWVRRVLQLVAPSTLFTDLPLPFAFGFDVTTYAAFDDLLSGGGPVTDYYWGILVDALANPNNNIILPEYAEALAELLNESVTASPNGELIVTVPKLWFRDP